MSAISLPLEAITGLSPYNVREAVEAIDETMVASIRAIELLQPIVVRADGRGFEVLDGGRRYAALLAIAESDGVADPVWAWHDTRPESQAREASLAANVVRRQLHPVEEFEAFTRLVSDGLAVERIAEDFAVETRFVRQRLALSRLSAAVRQAWRAGEITADAASAFTLAPSQAEQDAVLSDFRARRWLHQTSFIRERFTKESIRADGAEARYVGLDAYAAAGGAIDDNLFEDFSLCLDGGLLKRLARDKMMAEGEALAERYGYGFVAARSEVEREWDWGHLPPDYTAEERERLATIDQEIDALDTDGDDASTPPDELAGRDIAWDLLEQEREEITSRAVQRGGTAAQRAQAGILVRLELDGTLAADMGRIPPKSDKTERVANPRVADLAPDPAPAGKPAEPAEEKKPGKALVECLDHARTEALARLVGERPDLAMILVTAILAPTFTGAPLRIRVDERNGADEGRHDTFAAHLGVLLGPANREIETLQTRFATAVAATIVVRTNYESTGRQQSNAPDTAALCDVVAAFSGGDTYPQALREALDYDAYFKAATRAAAIAAVAEAGGDADHARGLKKVEASAYAAGFCRDKGWLPPELRPAERPKAKPAKDLRSLADAMATALAEDGVSLDPAPEPGQTIGIADDVYAVSDFLAEACERVGGALAKASELYEAYLTRLAGRQPDVDKVQTFSAAVTASGIDKKRRSDGVHFLDLRLADPARVAA